MTASELLSRLDSDPLARLKWRVLRRLGIPPLSLTAALLGRRRVLELACHLALDAGAGQSTGRAGENPGFDMARFRELGGGA
ncbi:MAG: hypothetical protein IJ705_06325 [Oscillospiraceae bacterium]|nr:hypothetical protein [Oscillospiraceae bacterium]